MSSEGIALEIEAMKGALNVLTDMELAEFLDVSSAAISQWRKRGSIPASAKKKVEAYAPYGKQARAMGDRRRELGQQLLYEGRRLAIYLAPSLDAAGRRISSTAYVGLLSEYTSLFNEIEVACAEEVEAERTLNGGNATDSLDRLTLIDPTQLLDRIFIRANWWRYGGAVPELATGRPTLHEPRSNFKRKARE